MSELNQTPSPSGSAIGPALRRSLSVWPRPFLLGGALVGGMVLGAGSLALAASAPGHFGWHRGPHLDRIQKHVLTALDSVGATSAQEARIHDIIATTVSAMDHDQTERGALRKQVFDLLRAPNIDRAAVEKMRADQVARFDAKSKAIVSAVLEAADQLTPDQRAKLADRAEAMMDRGPMGGHWGHRDGRPGGDRSDRPEDGQGQDGGKSDASPDKG